MSKQFITVTSKNQVTLPSKYVKQLRLTNNRILQTEIRNGKIILTPEPDVETVMQQFWGKHKAKRTLGDDEINQALRGTATTRAKR